MEKVHCELTGGDGNAIAIVGRVCKALRRSNADPDIIAEYRSKALDGNYDALIRASTDALEKAGISYS